MLVKYFDCIIKKKKNISNLIEFESSYCIENFEGKLKKIKMLLITNSYTYQTFIENLTEFIILESKENDKINI